MYNLTINNHWLEVAKLVLELAFCVSPTEEVNSFHNGVTLKMSHKIMILLNEEVTYLALEHWFCRFLFVADNAAAATLNEWCHTLLKLNLHPLHVLKMQDKHVRCEYSALYLATINKHALLVDDGAVIFARARREARRLALSHSSLVCIELE